ncbi:1-acyl-sn-glycerol-3-phosphate acyltransferase [Telmatospirillum sp. J64-1]|uniref:lysophospholipid acyltransferase family protein n=1 Tax=Telmatospirillum sp. J64-1 TaxID=2502183 RepID=UPI00115ED9CF|nr:lysophospholipid acyltransferase family protein [Telmatospirillum sp. J64-1]
MVSRSLAAFRLVLFLLWTLLYLLPFSLALLVCRPCARDMQCFFWRVAVWLMGIKIVIHGKLSKDHPLLYVSNHISYMDIPILGSVLPASFVSKAEVGTWPVIGWLSRLGRTVFINRRRQDSKTHRNEILNRLQAGDSLILFPEATSHDGNRVLPFKSALFSVAEYRPNDRALPVQPVTIAYTRLNGIPIGYAWRPYFAWYGDMELAPHIWHLLGLGRLRVDIILHTPVGLDSFPDRRALARHCYETVKAGLLAANTGRWPEEGDTPAR